MSPTPAYDPEDGYRQLVAAILRQAVRDAQGETFAPGTQNPAQVQAEAQQWLAEETGVRDLVELCGVDSAPVLRRVRLAVKVNLTEGTAIKTTVLFVGWAATVTVCTGTYHPQRPQP